MFREKSNILYKYFPDCNSLTVTNCCAATATILHTHTMRRDFQTLEVSLQSSDYARHRFENIVYLKFKQITITVLKVRLNNEQVTENPASRVLSAPTASYLLYSDKYNYMYCRTYFRRHLLIILIYFREAWPKVVVITRILVIKLEF